MKTKHPLNYPEYYFLIPEKERLKGRCGAGDGFGEKLVPDFILGVKITEACQIHDKEWSPAWNPMIQAALLLNEADKNMELMRIFHKSNEWLKENILIIINNESANWFMIWLRSKIAKKYYEAVELARNVFWREIEDYINRRSK